MWRPENWNNPHTKIDDRNFESLADAYFIQLADAKHTVYEAGADAMLEALRQLGNSRGGREESEHRKGTWILIDE